MSISQIISIFQIIVSAVLIVAILLQQRGASAGGVFGGLGSSYYTKRGVEKILFIATICLGVIFLALAIAALLVR